MVSLLLLHYSVESPEVSKKSTEPKPAPKKKPQPDEKDTQKKELFDSPGAVKLKPPKRRPSQTDDPSKVELKPFDKKRGSITGDDPDQRPSIDKRRPSDVSKRDLTRRPSTTHERPEDEDEEFEEEVAPTSEKVAHSAPKKEPMNSKSIFC